MRKKVQSFGAVISELIGQGPFSVEAICRKMKIKSQTTLNRIMKDESSPKRIASFLEAFREADPLQLSEEDYMRLYEALRVNEVGYENYVVHKSMLSFLDRAEPVKPCICHKVFGQEAKFATLKELFASYSSYQSVKIIVHNCISKSVADAMLFALEMPGGDQLKIEHYISKESDPARGIANFLDLLPVINHPNYECFSAPFLRFAEGRGSNIFGNGIFISKLTNDNKALMDVVNFSDEQSFTMLYSIDNKDVHDFYSGLFMTARAQHQALKFSNCDMFDPRSYADFMRRQLVLERRHEEFEMKKDISVKCLPPKIYGRLLEERFGPVNQEEKAEVIQLLERRYEAFLGKKKRYVGIFSKAGLRSFVREGNLLLWGEEATALQPSEVKTVLRGMISAARSNPNIEFYLLKQPIRDYGCSYQLYANSRLCLVDNRPHDARHYYTGMIKTNYILRGFHSFVEEELLRNYTYSREETLEILERMISLVQE